MKTKIKFNCIDDIEDLLPIECINACSHSGGCDADVAYWVEEFEWNIPRAKLIEFCEDNGLSITDDELTSSLEERVLWVKACDAAERV